jgi:hypothetical protein
LTTPIESIRNLFGPISLAVNAERTNPQSHREGTRLHIRCAIEERASGERF